LKAKAFKLRFCAFQSKAEILANAKNGTISKTRFGDLDEQK